MYTCFCVLYICTYINVNVYEYARLCIRLTLNVTMCAQFALTTCLLVPNDFCVFLEPEYMALVEQGLCTKMSKF